jgi:hypothetical protein
MSERDARPRSHARYHPAWAPDPNKPNVRRRVSLADERRPYPSAALDNMIAKRTRNSRAAGQFPWLYADESTAPLHERTADDAERTRAMGVIVVLRRAKPPNEPSLRRTNEPKRTTKISSLVGCRSENEPEPTRLRLASRTRSRHLYRSTRTEVSPRR